MAVGSSQGISPRCAGLFMFSQMNCIPLYITPVILSLDGLKPVAPGG